MARYYYYKIVYVGDKVNDICNSVRKELDVTKVINFRPSGFEMLRGTNKAMGWGRAAALASVDSGRKDHPAILMRRYCHQTNAHSQAPPPKEDEATLCRTGNTIELLYATMDTWSTKHAPLSLYSLRWRTAYKAGYIPDHQFPCSANWHRLRVFAFESGDALRGHFYQKSDDGGEQKGVFDWLRSCNQGAMWAALRSIREDQYKNVYSHRAPS